MSLPLYFTCVARIITSSLSLGILSMKHGRIFPLPPPHFFGYNISPHGEIINRWERWERFPVRAARYFGSQASTLWFPGWGAEDRPELDCLSHRAELEKPDRNHRYLSLLSARYRPHTHALPQVETQVEELGVIFTAKHQWGLDVLPRASRVVLRQEHLSDWALMLFEWSCAHSWITLESSRFSQALGPGPFQSNLQTNTDH